MLFYRAIDAPLVLQTTVCLVLQVLFDVSTNTLLCGDLFTQPGSRMPAVTESEVLTSSETMRKAMEYYAHATNTSSVLERLASLRPTTLACQQGSAYRGDGDALLRQLASMLEKDAITGVLTA